MDKQYCDNEIKKLEKELVPYNEAVQKFFDLVSKTNDNKYSLLKEMISSEDYCSAVRNMESAFSFAQRYPDMSDIGETEQIITSENIALMKNFSRIQSTIRCYQYRLRDTEPMRFDGDIIITDPCYIRRKDDKDETYFEVIEKFGMWRGTIYGDWSCSTVNTDTNSVIGEFCADGGMVCVLPLDKVLEYNPDFNYHIERPFSTTLIKDFHGTVQFTVEEETYTDEDDEDDGFDEDELDDSEYTEYEVHVVGTGNINFKTFQTGL